MGNEMGNNNTSAIREEDNISETEKNTLLEDASENANGVSQDVHADGVKEENQNIPTSIASDVTDKALKASNDITTELGNDTQQEEGHEDYVKEKIQMIPTAEANDSKEKAIWFGSKSTRSMLENDSLEGDAHTSEVNMEIQMHPTAEAEDVKEKATGLASEDTTTDLGKVTLQEDSHADDVKEKIHMIPKAEAKDVQEKATRLISNNAESSLENDSLEGDTQESDLNIENQKHPTLASDSTRSSLENDSLKGDTHEDVNVDHQENQKAEVKDDQEIAAMLGFDDKTSEHEDKPQEDKQDGNAVIPIANGTDVQGKTTIAASDDPLNLINSSGGAVDEITEIRKPEKSPNAESVEGEGENSESLSFEGSEEYEKREESYLRKHPSVTYNHHLNNEPSIKQDEEETMVVTLNAVNMSNDSELLESLSVYSDHDDLVKFHSERSLQGTESLLKDNLLDTNSHFQQIKEGVLEEEMESQEKNLSTDESHGRDGNELGSGLVDTSGATSDSPCIGNNSNGNLLTMVDYTTEDSLNLLLESFVVDNHEENCKVLLHEERKLSRSGSTTENSHDHKPDQCMKDSLKEHKSGMVNTYDMTIESTGERNIALDSSVSGIINNAQVEEPKVIENGLQFDAFVNNSNKASDESSAASEQNHSIVPEAEAVFLIADLTVVDCRHEEEESYKNKIEETNEKQEASYAMVKTLEGTEMSEQCSSDMTKSLTVTSMPNSDWKQTNDGEYFGATIDKLDSSKVTVPSQDLVDDEAFEKEGEDYSQHTEATSAVTMFIDEPCSNNSIFANGGYETRDSITRLSTESNPDNVNISCQMQKSPSFNLNLRIEARPEESDQTPLLCQDKSANESLSNQTSPNPINSMPHAEYDQSILEMPVEEKIVTMERSYSEKSKASFIGFLKEEEETHLLVMPETQDNHARSKKPVKEVSSTSPKGKEKRKPRSSFFSSCMCCATVTNPNP